MQKYLMQFANAKHHYKCVAKAQPDGSTLLVCYSYMDAINQVLAEKTYRGNNVKHAFKLFCVQMRLDLVYNIVLTDAGAIMQAAQIVTDHKRYCRANSQYIPDCVSNGGPVFCGNNNWTSNGPSVPVTSVKQLRTTATCVCGNSVIP